MKAYLANGLFSEAERLYNGMLAWELRADIEGLDLYLPQENAAVNDKNSFADSIMIAKADTEKLLESDFMIAVLDGNDTGVAAEIGIFSTTGKPIFALYTDVRQQGADNELKIDALKNMVAENQFSYTNLFVIGLVKQSPGGVYTNTESLIEAILEVME